jgi:hypothetical protein
MSDASPMDNGGLTELEAIPVLGSMFMGGNPGGVTTKGLFAGNETSPPAGITTSVSSDRLIGGFPETPQVVPLGKLTVVSDGKLTMIKLSAGIFLSLLFVDV